MPISEENVIQINRKISKYLSGKIRQKSQPLQSLEKIKSELTATILKGCNALKAGEVVNLPAGLNVCLTCPVNTLDFLNEVDGLFSICARAIKNYKTFGPNIAGLIKSATKKIEKKDPKKLIETSRIVAISKPSIELKKVQLKLTEAKQAVKDSESLAGHNLQLNLNCSETELLQMFGINAPKKEKDPVEGNRARFNPRI